MSSNEGLLKAGEILLLVGAIMAAIGALFMLVAAVGVGAVFSTQAGGDYPAAVIAVIYGGMALIMGVGAVLDFMAYNRSKAGDMDGAFLFGLIGSMLLPVQVIPLLGAIFCKVGQEPDA